MMLNANEAQVRKAAWEVTRGKVGGCRAWHCPLAGWTQLPSGLWGKLASGRAGHTNGTSLQHRYYCDYRLLEKGLSGGGGMGLATVCSQQASCFLL